MDITVKRLGSNKDVNLDVSRIKIMVDGKEYTLTNCFGELKVHAHHDVLTIKPCCANECTVFAEDK